MRGVIRAAADEPYDAGCRVKRIKTQIMGIHSGTSSLESRDLNNVDRPTQKNSPALDSTIAENKKHNSACIEMVQPSKQHRASKRNGPSKVFGAVKSRSNSVSLQDPPMSSLEGTPPAPLQLTNDEIDVSTAPADPFDLAIWVAQAIRRIHDGLRTSVEADDEHCETKRKLLCHEPVERLTQKDVHGNVVRAEEREQQRDERRRRKQKWRNEHRGENNDNDLRCRINSRAKTLYGINVSAEKTQFMEAEFERRKARRNSKGNGEAALSGFTFDPELLRKLFSVHDADHPNKVKAAGILLINTLEGFSSNVDGESNREAATALNFALKDSRFDSGPFTEALRILGADSGVIEAINLAMKDHKRVANADCGITTMANTMATRPTAVGSRCTSIIKESPSSFRPASGLRGGAANGYSVDNHYQSSDAIKALNAATLILSDIAEGSSGHYVTPYGNPQPSICGATNGDVNGMISTNGGHTKESIEPSTSGQPNSAKPLTKSQIDALLEFANGGSLMDNDDDDSVPDAPDDATEPGNQDTTQQPDFDINATLQRIITQLTADESGGRDHLGFPIATSQADKAAALQRLFAEAGISINTVIPAAQAHATSQLYAHLSSRAHKFPTSGGINPVHASAYGNTAQMTQRMLARPVNITQPLKAAPSASRGNVVGPPARKSRGRSTEEIRKIREYGFPPLPGSRPGLQNE